MGNPLQDLKFSTGQYMKLDSSSPAKVRIFTRDPMISKDNFGNIRYSFAVWSYNDNRPMIISKGTSIAKPIQTIDADEDYGADVTLVDLKIKAEGSGKETRYTVSVLPKAQELTQDQIDSVEELDRKLPKIIKNGIRASQYNILGELPTDEVSDEPFTDPEQ